MEQPNGPLMDEDTIDRYIQHAFHADEIAVDTETTGVDHIRDGRDYLTGISIAFDLTGAGYFSAYFPFRHVACSEQNLDRSSVLPKLATLFASKPTIFHNLKYDLHSLKTIGITDFHEEQYCTMMLAHMVNEEWPSKKLEWLVPKLLKRELPGKDQVGSFAKVFGWENVPPHLMALRAKEDAESTLELKKFLWERMAQQDLTELWPHERDFTRTLFNMEQAGVGVNVDFCTRKAEQGRSRMAAIERELGFNPSSHTALSKFFFDELNLPVLKRTPGGKPSLDKSVMNEYDEILAGSTNKSARLVLEFRGWQKAVTSLYEAMLNKISPDGLVRTNFKQHGTVTGRLSSSEPNLQQIPRRTDQEWNGDAKQAFHAGDDDFELWGWDYSQLEFRLAASYGSEALLLDEFSKTDGDVFTALSEQIGAPRQVTKTYTYATIYGAGLTRIAATLNKSESEVEETYERFLESISGIKKASRTATRLAKQRRYVRYWNGRRRHFPWDEGHHKAFNSILQGGGAELVKRSQLRCRELEDANCQMVLQVHDEIVFKIRKGFKDKYEPEIIERMTDWPQFPVKFAVEGKQWNK